MKKLLLILIFTLISSTCLAQTLRVGFVDHRPYVNTDSRDYPGIAITLWKQIATHNHWKYKLINAGIDTDAAIEKLYKNKLDVLIGGISITTPRLQQVDFSYPFFISSVGLMVRSNDDTFKFHLLFFLKSVLSLKLLIPFLLIFIFIHLFWWIGRDDDVVPKAYLKGLGNSIWLCACLMLPGSLEYKSTYVKLRYVSLAIMFVALFLTSMIVATITSGFTASLLKGSEQINNLDSLMNKTVASIAGTASTDIAKHHGLRVRVVANYQQATDLLLSHQITAIVTDIPSAIYFLNSHPDLKLAIAPYVFRYNELMFAFKRHSTIIRPFNITLAMLQDNGQLERTCSLYLRKRDAKLCSL